MHSYQHTHDAEPLSCRGADWVFSTDDDLDHVIVSDLLVLTRLCSEALGNERLDPKDLNVRTLSSRDVHQPWSVTATLDEECAVLAFVTIGARVVRVTQYL